MSVLPFVCLKQLDFHLADLRGKVIRGITEICHYTQTYLTRAVTGLSLDITP